MKRDFIRASSKKKKGEKQGTSKSDSSLQLILMQRLLHAHIAPISRLTSFVKYKKFLKFNQKGKERKVRMS